MKIQRSPLLCASVLTIGILAATTFSSEAFAWGSRASNGGGGNWGQHRQSSGGAASHDWGNREGATRQWQGHEGDDNEGGWRNKLKTENAEREKVNAEGQQSETRGNWREKMKQNNAAADSASKPATTEQQGSWRDRWNKNRAATTNGSGGESSAAAPAVENREPVSGERTGTYTRDNGGSGTWEQEYTRGEGTSTRSTTATNQNGQSASWTTEQAVTHSEGTVSGSTTVTGQNGKTYASSSTLNTAEHTYEKSYTGANGQTHGYTLQGDGTPGDGNRTGTYTTQNGQSGNYNQQVTYGDGAVTRQNTVTNANGQSSNWTTQKSVSKENGVVSGNTTVTGQGGKSASWDMSYDPATKTVVHSSTGPNGQTHGGTVTQTGSTLNK